MATGIVKRHSGGCSATSGGRCRCNAGWQATVYSPRDKKKLRKSFRTSAEARSWRADAKRALDRGTLRAPAATTVQEAATAWLVGAEAGEILNGQGQPYKPATLRGYRQSLNDRVLPMLGDRKLAAVTTSDLQALVDRWVGEGQPPATIRNAVKPLQVIYRRARTRGGLAVNPTHDLELPAPRSKEAEVVAPEVGAALLAAVCDEDRALWATALYSGLRYGELRALRWRAVDLAGGTIRVTESWDPKAGAIDPKTATSRRSTPIPGLLRDALLDHRLRQGRPDDDALVFGDDRGLPFHAASLYRRADRAWRAAELGSSLRLHQARHTYASFMIAAGVNAKALSSFMGHSSIKVTFDLYGHLMPGAATEAAALLDSFLSTDVEVAEDEVRAAAV